MPAGKGSSGRKRSSENERNEEYFAKREKNNEAVKKSREKTKEKAKVTHERVEELKKENLKLEIQIEYQKNRLMELKESFLTNASLTGSDKVPQIDFDDLLKNDTEDEPTNS